MVELNSPVLHVGTEMVSRFAILNPDGTVKSIVPISCFVSSLTAEAWLEILGRLTDEANILEEEAAQ